MGRTKDLLLNNIKFSTAEASEETSKQNPAGLAASEPLLKMHLISLLVGPQKRTPLFPIFLRLLSHLRQIKLWPHFFGGEFRNKSNSLRGDFYQIFY